MESVIEQMVCARLGQSASLEEALHVPPGVPPLVRAEIFAKVAHRSIDQRRKYTGDAYETHPARVAALVGQFGGDDEMRQAAWLHDVVEDVLGNSPKSLETLLSWFSPGVVGLVDDLTDKFNDKQFGTRAQRKALEQERLATISARAQTIRICDIIDNCRDVARLDPAFAPVYLREKTRVLAGMKSGSAQATRCALDVVVEGWTALGTADAAPAEPRARLRMA